jgi:hypothetical protein
VAARAACASSMLFSELASVASVWKAAIWAKAAASGFG